MPYRGAGPALQDLMGGQVDMMFDGLGSSANHIKGGRLKAIAVAGDKRAPGFADLPTAAEAGLPDYKVSTWYGLWAPKGTPAPVVERMSAELKAAFASKELQDGLGQHRRGAADTCRQGLRRLRRRRDQALGRGGQGRQHQGRLILCGRGSARPRPPMADRCAPKVTAHTAASTSADEETTA